LRGEHEDHDQADRMTGPVLFALFILVLAGKAAAR
jgi:hypothetical protein